MTLEKLQDDDEVLLRQIHPAFIENGHIASSTFVPSQKDNNQLSVDRSSVTTAAASHALFIENGFQSVAVYGVTVGEFKDKHISCYADPLPATEALAANPAHALADYSNINSSQRKKIAKILSNQAAKRGCLYPAS